MADIYGTWARLLEQLALHGELSISKLARESGLSYPTTFYTASSLPFLSQEKVGKEKRLRIEDYQIDVVYPFLIAMQTNRVKKTQLALAFLARKGFNEVLLGGELALQMQLYVKDADPNPDIELRIKESRVFLSFLEKALQHTIASELKTNLQIVEDHNLSLASKVGMVSLSRPEKILVDAIAEKKSKVLIENVTEAIASSLHSIDMNLLESYARERSVFEQTMRELDAAKEAGFP